MSKDNSLEVNEAISRKKLSSTKKNLQWHSSVRADDEGLESVSMISIPDSLFKTRPEQTEIFSECASLKNSKTTNKADQSNQTEILDRH